MCGGWQHLAARAEELSKLAHKGIGFCACASRDVSSELIWKGGSGGDILSINLQLIMFNLLNVTGSRFAVSAQNGPGSIAFKKVAQLDCYFFIGFLHLKRFRPFCACVVTNASLLAREQVDDAHRLACSLVEFAANSVQKADVQAMRQVHSVLLLLPLHTNTFRVTHTHTLSGSKAGLRASSEF